MHKQLAALSLAFLLSSCGGGGMKTPDAQMSGNWHGDIVSTIFGNLPVDMFIVQNGSTLSSTSVSFSGTCSVNGTMTGSVTGNSVKMMITGNNGDTLTITGSLSGTSLSGTYATTTSGCSLKGETGAVSGSPIPSVQGASWTGGTQSTHYPPGSIKFTANLTEDNAGNITGTLTVTQASGSSTSCAPLAMASSVTGTQIGEGVNLTDNQPDGLGLAGTLDSAAKNLSGNYGVSICNGDNGNITMSRP